MLTLLSIIQHLGVYHYRHPEEYKTTLLAETFSREPIIESVDLNHIRKKQAVPTDPSFTEQWYLHNSAQLVNGYVGNADVDIDWPEAMDVFSGTQEVIVAVIDSGVSVDHPEILPTLWTNDGEIPYNSIDDDANGYVDDSIGWDFVADDNIP